MLYFQAKCLLDASVSHFELCAASVATVESNAKGAVLEFAFRFSQFLAAFLTANHVGALLDFLVESRGSLSIHVVSPLKQQMQQMPKNPPNVGFGSFFAVAPEIRLV